MDVSHVSSRGSSLRITIPKKVIQRLDIKPEDIIGFFDDDGRVTIEKIE
ncbi:AbrB/MazE/SpoVT family DNA-binding domain-containing protein [Thermoplasma sp.]|nr:AbrB/MazE/SpoVT family DNA-binding domain-containing protein [Thermoplasma sp.]KAA8923407.1 MAG: AbrB/MazE/SpoVT family DNA-binding domain-containing protein [Thermoplasma sp.]